MEMTLLAVATWLGLAVIAYVAADRGGLLGMYAGHWFVAVLWAVWEVATIENIGANEETDLDIVFSIGLLARIVIVNCSLLSVSAIGLYRFANRVHPTEDRPAMVIAPLGDDAS